MVARHPSALSVPLALDGSPATVGTLGRWLCDPSDLLATDIEMSNAIAHSTSPLRLSFPRNWPAVFKQSAALKGLVNGELRGVRCRVISTPPAGPDASTGAAAAAGLISPLHSFLNAERLAVALPEWRLVKGFVVYECQDAPEGARFVAIRHWWNASPAGTWLDYTPPLVPCDGGGKLLLVESRSGEKLETPLRGSGQAFAIALGRRLSGLDASCEATGSMASPLPQGAGQHLSCEDQPREKAALVPSPDLGHPGANWHSMEAATISAERKSYVSAHRRDEATEEEEKEEERQHAVDSAPAPAAAAASASLHAHPLPPRASEVGIVEQSYDSATGEAMDNAVNARQGDGDEMRARADALFRNGHVDEAAKLYAFLAEPVVATAVAAKEAGNAAFKRGDMKEANAAYEAGLRAIGLDVHRYNYFADQAAAEYGRIMRRMLPNQFVFALFSNRAATLLRLQRYKEAVDDATRALKEKPSDLKARLRRAAAFRAVGGPCNIMASANDYAHAMQLDPSSSDIVSKLVEVWLERAPGMGDFVEEVRVAAEKAGGRGEGGRAAVLAVERAMCEALHNVGTSGEWARRGMLGKAALDKSGRQATSVDASRLLARASCAKLLHVAGPIAKRPHPDNDDAGARCLLRLVAWIVGIKNAMETEDAVLKALHIEVKSDWSPMHTTSTLERLCGPEPMCVGLLQLLEALCRRRVANLRKMDHPLEVLLRIFSFRSTARVRATAVSLMAWCARCPRAKAYLFDRYSEDQIRPVKTAMKDYARLCGIEQWELDPNTDEYHEETGICLSDGGTHAGILNPDQRR